MNKGILDLLRADGSIVVNKRLIRGVGLVEAVVYSELASRYCYFRDRGKLSEGDYFFNTKEDLEEATGATRRQQDSAIKTLVSMKLMEMKVMGIPATRHFRFTNANLNKLTSLLLAEKQEADKDPEDLLVEVFQGLSKVELSLEAAEDIKKQARSSQARMKSKAKWKMG